MPKNDQAINAEAQTIGEVATLIELTWELRECVIIAGYVEQGWKRRAKEGSEALRVKPRGLCCVLGRDSKRTGRGVVIAHRSIEKQQSARAPANRARHRAGLK